MQIYNPNNELLLDIPVDDASYHLHEIMGANSLELRFSLPEFVPIVEGSYCDFKAERYWMPRAVDYVKEHSQKFSYTLSLEGAICFLKSTKFKFFDYVTENGLIKPTSPFTLKFPITATPRMVAELLVANLKLKYPQYAWAVGDCIDSEPVVMDFNHDFCFDVLPKLADAFKTEWELDKFAINIGKVEKMKDSAIDLSYGYNNGILGGIRRMQFDSSRIINRVYIEGGERNIDRSTYGNGTLLLPRNEIITYEGIDYKTDASGSYLERAEPLAGEEDSLDVSKFYPKRVGTVSAVEVINDAQGFYNIIDDSIPADLDYSKMIIAGETMTLIFQTGQLAGKEFDVKYIHATRKFELVPIDDNGLIYPQGNIIPATGDTYAVFHMRMPDNYISLAETEALQETVKYLWENEQPQYSYRWQLDSIYAKRNWGAISGFLNIGYFVRSSDPQFLPEAVAVRIVAVKEPVNDPQSLEITIANSITSRTLGAIINEIPTQEQAVDRKDREIREYAKRRWKDSQELIDAMYDPSGNFQEEVISSLVMQAMLLRLGDTTLQYQFLEEDWTTAKAFSYVYDKETHILSIPESRMQHMTLTLGDSGGLENIDSVQPDRPVSQYLYWNIEAFSSEQLLTADAPYYLYVQCSTALTDNGTRRQGTGRFILSETKIGLNDVDGYFTFWLGFLNSEFEGDRSFRTVYGYTEILPGQMTIDKIISTNGLNWLDLLDGTGQFANGNLFWNALGNLFLTGQFQTNTPAGKLGLRIKSDDSGTYIDFSENWNEATEALVSRLYSDYRIEPITVWNPVTGSSIVLNYAYKRGTLQLAGLGGCTIDGNQATFGSKADNDSYLSIDWRNKTSPEGQGTSPVAGPLTIDMKGMRISDGLSLPQYRVYVDENGFFKLKL